MVLLVHICFFFDFSCGDNHRLMILSPLTILSASVSDNPLDFRGDQPATVNFSFFRNCNHAWTSRYILLTVVYIIQFFWDCRSTPENCSQLQYCPSDRTTIKDMETGRGRIILVTPWIRWWISTVSEIVIRIANHQFNILDYISLITLNLLYL